MNLITIYDDEKGSKTAYIAPVLITYEEALGEMTSIALGGPLKNPERRYIAIEIIQGSGNFPQ